MGRILTSGTDPGTAVWEDGTDAVSVEAAWKTPCCCATTADIALVPAPAVIDGVTLAEGNRTLVKNQAAPAENGLYRKTGANLVRTTDYAEDAFVAGGLKVYVQEGTANAKKTFRMFTTGTIDVGTTATSWEEDGGGGGGDLATTLAAGNTSGGTNITLTAGDKLTGGAAAGTLVLESHVLGGASLGYNNTAITKGSTAIGHTNTVASYGFAAGLGNTQHATSTFAVTMGDGNTAGRGSYRSTLIGNSNSTISNADYYANGCLLLGSSNNVYRDAGGGYGYYAHAIGKGNSLTNASYSFGIGRNNTIDHTDGYNNNDNTRGVSFAGGQSSFVYSGGSFTWGMGNRSDWPASWSAMFGKENLVDVAGQFAHGAVGNNAGAFQASFFSLGTGTTNATPTNAVSRGSGAESSLNRLTVRAGHTVAFTAIVTARQMGGAAGTVGDWANWHFKGTITRDLANNTTLNELKVGSSIDVALNGGGNQVVDAMIDTLAVAAAPTDNIVAAAAWRVQFVANDTDEALRMTVTGEASKNINFFAHIITAETGTSPF